MIRRTSILAACAATALTFLGTGTATASGAAPGESAATGYAVINGVTHVNPQGCYPVGGWMVHVINHTDQTAQVFPNAGCFGQAEGWLSPGAEAQLNGASVYFP
ncbi:hypothetical protein [Streptomyces sp. G45]|uniref:hypothetical protein n=1 Tax=Streptomyces sp. G45 TaxID=3406627 RepID=UPI003C274BA6